MSRRVLLYRELRSRDTDSFARFSDSFFGATYYREYNYSRNFLYIEQAAIKEDQGLPKGEETKGVVPLCAQT